MKKSIDELKRYLDLTLGVQVKIQPWETQKELPFFLIDLYDFFEASLLKQKCIFMVAKSEAEITPGAIEKQREQVRKKWSGLCIYVHQRISPHNRFRLIQYHIPFIIPGNQMYLPELGIDLREHFKKIQEKSKKFLSPAAQLAIIYVLVKETINKLTPSMLAKQIGYSVMSMSRAFDEIKAANLGEVDKQGRELYWIVESKKELWEQAKGIMRSPVKNRLWLKKNSLLKKAKVLAGLSAISCYSKLNPPLLPIYAIGSNDLKNLKLLNCTTESFDEDAAAELEVWGYDPNLFQQNNYVDPISLYLSLRDSTDERVASALEEMMVH